MFVRYTLVRQH